MSGAGAGRTTKGNAVASVFDISALSDMVALDDQGVGETTFTVSNHPDRARRGRAEVRVDPGGPAQASWFTIEDREREFNVDGVKQVQQFTVKVKVPVDKPLKGSFRLVVASVRLPDVPDEHFTVGPPVGFEVKSVEPVVDGRPFPWWIVAVGVLVLLLVGGGLTWWLWPPSKVAVPDLVKQARADAEQLLEEADLAVGTVTEQESSEAPGSVLSQSPAAGAEVASGSEVNLVVSKPTSFVEVPNVVGQRGRDAMKLLQDRGLVPMVRQEGEGTPGIVARQNPKAGVRVTPKTQVDIFLPGVVRVPDLVGKSFDMAKGALAAVGLRLGSVSTTVGPPRGTIVKMSPGPNEIAKPGQSVDLLVSKGPS